MTSEEREAQELRERLESMGRERTARANEALFWSDKYAQERQAREADLTREREANAKLRAALIHAEEWLDAEGCDCGTDEPGTCALCECRAALAEAAPPRTP